MFLFHQEHSIKCRFIRKLVPCKIFIWFTFLMSIKKNVAFDLTIEVMILIRHIFLTIEKNSLFSIIEKDWNLGE